MSRPVRVIFVNRFFHPDQSATSRLLTELAGELAAAGLDVQVVTSRQRIDEPRAGLGPREVVAGASVHRVWTSRFGRLALAGRALDYLTFYMSAGVRLLGLCRRGDVVVAETDPPLVSVVAAAAARLRGGRLVNWLQDLFPEVAERLGVGPVRGPAARCLRALRDRSLRAARVNVVPGERMAGRLAELGLPAARVRVVHNWCDGEAIRPLPRCGHPLRRAWGVEGRFVVAYSGNMGYAHEFETVLDAAGRLGRRPDVVFVFIGGGVRRAWLEAEVARRGLANVAFRPYQPPESLNLSLTAADVHLVTLLPCLEGLIVPSKFYGIAAAGRPVLFVGDPGGEIARLVDESGCGHCVAAGGGGELARHIAALAADAARCARLGAAARRLFERRFDKPLAVAAWRGVLDEAGRA